MRKAKTHSDRIHTARASSITLVMGLAASFLAPGIAAGDTWSVRTKCKAGDWQVWVELVGFGSLDASCADGEDVRRVVDAGDLYVSGAGIEGTSSNGATCDLPAGEGTKLSLECESESDEGRELASKAELEVEVELEERQDSEDEEGEDE